MFSNVTGESVVTVCWDNKLRVYDVGSNIGSGNDKISPKKTIAHNNNTGQWLTPFKVNNILKVKNTFKESNTFKINNFKVNKEVKVINNFKVANNL